MAKDTHHAAPKGRPVDEVEIDRAFLDIPDAENEAIGDAHRTYWVTVVSGIVFVAVVSFFVLF